MALTPEQQAEVEALRKWLQDSGLWAKQAQGDSSINKKDWYQHRKQHNLCVCLPTRWPDSTYNVWLWNTPDPKLLGAPAWKGDLRRSFSSAEEVKAEIIVYLLTGELSFWSPNNEEI